MDSMWTAFRSPEQPISYSDMTPTSDTSTTLLFYPIELDFSAPQTGWNIDQGTFYTGTSETSCGSVIAPITITGRRSLTSIYISRATSAGGGWGVIMDWFG